MRRLLLAALAFLLTVAALWEPARTLPQHIDEQDYAWSGYYYAERLAHMDLSSPVEPTMLDPGWSPTSFWAVSQPMGARLIYGAVMLNTRSTPPDGPYYRDIRAASWPDSTIPPNTLIILRGVAVLCSGLGLALIVLRLGWTGLLGCALFLAIPAAREDLARAWAEGPLLLGFGLFAASFGSNWIALALAVAATMKPTAIALWPVALWRRAGGSPRAAITVPLVWSALTPPSWFGGGPAYLALMALFRALEYGRQSGWQGGPAMPTRYLWPFELAVFLGLAVLFHRLASRELAREPGGIGRR